MTSLKNDIKRILNITFPELEHMTGIFTKSMLKLLQRYPSAHALAEVDQGELTRMLIEDSYGRKRGAFAEALLKAARFSIGTPSPMKDVILKQKVSLHLHLDEALREITDLLLETSRGTMSDDMGLLNSITGIGDKTAAGFLIEMGGDIQ